MKIITSTRPVLYHPVMYQRVPLWLTFCGRYSTCSQDSGPTPSGSCRRLECPSTTARMSQSDLQDRHVKEQLPMCIVLIHVRRPRNAASTGQQEQGLYSNVVNAHW